MSIVRLLIGCATMCLVLAAVAPTLVFAPARGDSAAADGEQLFDLLELIAASRPFQFDYIGSTVGFPVTEAEIQPNKYFRVGKGRSAGDGMISAAEVRTARQPTSKFSGMVVLDIGQHVCIEERVVVGSFGPPQDLHVISPPFGERIPPTLPSHYIVYHRDWGKLSFGFALTSPNCLVSVVLNDEQPARTASPQPSH